MHTAVTQWLGIISARPSDTLAIIETAKLSGLNPEAYLADVLARINDHIVTRLDELLPWNWAPASQQAAQAA
jgi:hypothetical protein